MLGVGKERRISGMEQEFFNSLQSHSLMLTRTTIPYYTAHFSQLNLGLGFYQLYGLIDTYFSEKQ